jgi:hypothetical protein
MGPSKRSKTLRPAQDISRFAAALDQLELVIRVLHQRAPATWVAR